MWNYCLSGTRYPSRLGDQEQRACLCLDCIRHLERGKYRKPCRHGIELDICPRQTSEGNGDSVDHEMGRMISSPRFRRPTIPTPGVAHHRLWDSSHAPAEGLEVYGARSLFLIVTFPPFSMIQSYIFLVTRRRQQFPFLIAIYPSLALMESLAQCNTFSVLQSTRGQGPTERPDPG